MKGGGMKMKMCFKWEIMGQQPGGILMDLRDLLEDDFFFKQPRY